MLKDGKTRRPQGKTTGRPGLSNKRPVGRVVRLGRKSAGRKAQA